MIIIILLLFFFLVYKIVKAKAKATSYYMENVDLIELYKKDKKK